MPGVSTAMVGSGVPSGASETSRRLSSSVYASTGAMRSSVNSSGHARLATARFSST